MYLHNSIIVSTPRLSGFAIDPASARRALGRLHARRTVCERCGSLRPNTVTWPYRPTLLHTARHPDSGAGLEPCRERTGRTAHHPAGAPGPATAAAVGPHPAGTAGHAGTGLAAVLRRGIADPGRGIGSRLGSAVRAPDRGDEGVLHTGVGDPPPWAGGGPDKTGCADLAVVHSDTAPPGAAGPIPPEGTGTARSGDDVVPGSRVNVQIPGLRAVGLVQRSQSRPAPLRP